MYSMMFDINVENEMFMTGQHIGILRTLQLPLLKSSKYT